MINKFLFLICLFLILINQIVSANDEVTKLKNLYKEGIITQEELKKAITIIENNTNQINKNRIQIKKLFDDPSGTKFEKMYFYIDNYRIHTLAPGVVYIDNLLTGDTDVVIKNNFEAKFTSNGKKYFKFKLDKENLSSQLLYKGRMLINWSGKYVKKHRATFYQMQVLGYLPFHFYIKIQGGKKTIALNVEHFTDKINKAVQSVKEELAVKYNLSVSDIDRIMEKKQNRIDREIDRVITAEQEKILQELSEKYVGKEIDETIRAEIERTVGEEMADAFISAIEQASGEAIDDAIEAEVAAFVDEAIEYAIEQGVTQAAAEAAIAAMLWVYAMGGTDEQAMDACRYYAGDAC